jgi:hypothetical protein
MIKKLNMRAIAYWLIGLHVFATCSMLEVWRRLVDGRQAIWPSQWWDLPTAGALCQRRAQLGVTVMRSVLLMECGTHAIFDAELLSTTVQEQQGALQVVARSLTAGMLLLWDRGFHTHELIALVRSRESDYQKSKRARLITIARTSPWRHSSSRESAVE